MTARRFLASFTAGCLTVLGSVAAINMAVDVSGIYRSSGDDYRRHVRDYVQALRSTSQGLVKSPFDRAVKLELARTTTADCYVLGSSHEMLINRERFPLLDRQCRDLVNVAVSGASFEDVLSSLAIVADKAAGTRVIVGVPPWFYRRDADVRWREFSADYEWARTRFGLERGRAASAGKDKWLNLINAEYLRRNVQALRKTSGKLTAFPPIQPVVSPEQLADRDSVYLPDGSMVESRAGTVRAAEALVGTGDYKYSSVTAVPEVLREFESALRVLQRQGVEVTLLLMPYHPKVLRCAKPEICTWLSAAEAVSRELGARMGIPVIGGYDPGPLGLAHEDFYDYMHVAAEGLPKMSAALSRK